MPTGAEPGFCLFFLKNYLFVYFKDFYLFAFKERKGRRKRERNINVWLLLACLPLGTWLATQACALTGNQTSNPLVRRPALNPLNYTSQGLFVF